MGPITAEGRHETVTNELPVEKNRSRREMGGRDDSEYVTGERPFGPQWREVG